MYVKTKSYAYIIVEEEKYICRIVGYDNELCDIEYNGKSYKKSIHEIQRIRDQKLPWEG